MLKDRVPYHDMGAAEYNQRFRERELQYLQKKAAKLGYTLALASPITPQPELFLSKRLLGPVPVPEDLGERVLTPFLLQLYGAAGGNAKIEAFAGAPHSFGREPAHKDRLIAAAKAYIAQHTAATVAVSRPSQGRPPR